MSPKFSNKNLQTPETSNRESDPSMEMTWQSYAAAGIAMLAVAPSDSNAAVVYSGIQNAQFDSSTPSFIIDLNNDGLGDHSLYYRTFNYGRNRAIRFKSAYSNGTAYDLVGVWDKGADDLKLSPSYTTTTGYPGYATVTNPVILNATGPYGGAGNWDSGGGVFAQAESNTFYNSTNGTYGTTWAPTRGNWHGDTAYFGIEFPIAGVDHYGWIQMSVASDVSQATVIDWAYEDTPGAGIQIGATSGGASNSTVPEPGTLSLLALGAAGISLLRRRSMATRQDG